MKSSPYFDITEKINLKTISDLLVLNKEHTYMSPGVLLKDKPSEILPHELILKSHFLKEYYKTFFYSSETCGLFRGQTKSWPLLPSSYRIKLLNIKKPSEEKIRSVYESSNWQFHEFCKRAYQQNLDFPKSIIERMVIAQHYGIKTPLLDWTKNIFAAVYFAINYKITEEKGIFSPVIYHLKNERLLNYNIDEKHIEFINKSYYIKPLPLDKRIDRQFSALTFHPVPFYTSYKIPITEYNISEYLINDLRDIMQGMGLTSYHYFPDYAGIAEKIKQNLML